MLITKFLCIIIFINSCAAEEYEGRTETYEPEENYDSEENHESEESHESDENHENNENHEDHRYRHPHRMYYLVLCTVRPGPILALL